MLAPSPVKKPRVNSTPSQLLDLSDAVEKILDDDFIGCHISFQEDKAIQYTSREFSIEKIQNKERGNVVVGNEVGNPEVQVIGHAVLQSDPKPTVTSRLIKETLKSFKQGTQMYLFPYKKGYLLCTDDNNTQNIFLNQKRA